MTEADRIDEPMTRGGRRKQRAGPERRCIATGESGATDRLIRFVVSPGGEAVADLAGRLPGRGAWLTADRALVDRAVKKRLFSRAFRRPVEVAPDLADRLESLLARRLVETISLARRAGAAVAGAEKVRARILSGTVSVLIQATDGAADGREKLRKLAAAASEGTIESIEMLDSAELGLAFGREFAIHAALDAGGLAARACAEATRLSGLRAAWPTGGNNADQSRAARTENPAATSFERQAEPAPGSREQDDP